MHKFNALATLKDTGEFPWPPIIAALAATITYLRYHYSVLFDKQCNYATSRPEWSILGSKEVLQFE